MRTKNRVVQIRATGKAISEVVDTADADQGDLITAAFVLLEAGTDRAYKQHGGDGIVMEVAKMSSIFAYLLEMKRRESEARGEPEKNNARTVLANLVVAAFVALSTVEGEPERIEEAIEALRGDLRFEDQVKNLRELAVLLADGNGFGDTLSQIHDLPEF